MTNRTTKQNECDPVPLAFVAQRRVIGEIKAYVAKRVAEVGAETRAGAPGFRSFPLIEGLQIETEMDEALERDAKDDVELIETQGQAARELAMLLLSVQSESMGCKVAMSALSTIASRLNQHVLSGALSLSENDAKRLQSLLLRMDEMIVEEPRRSVFSSQMRLPVTRRADGKFVVDEPRGPLVVYGVDGERGVKLGEASIESDGSIKVSLDRLPLGEVIEIKEKG
jgi:hypothetical protein